MHKQANGDTHSQENAARASSGFCMKLALNLGCVEKFHMHHAAFIKITSIKIILN